MRAVRRFSGCVLRWATRSALVWQAWRLACGLARVASASRSARRQMAAAGVSAGAVAALNGRPAPPAPPDVGCGSSRRPVLRCVPGPPGPRG